MISKRYHVIATVLISLIAAQTSADILDEIVVTASKKEQAVRDVAATISTISANELAAISQTHINETLHRVPGVWISRGNGQEHLTAIRSPVLTGAGSCGAFLMMQDGISLRAPGFCNVNELFESTSELAGRMEVLKGPGSDIYGSNAMHGAINILTADLAAGLNKLNMEAGPQDYYRSRYSYSTDAVRVDVSGTTDGGYKDESGFDQQKLVLKYAADGYVTTLSYTNLNQETAGFIRGDEVYRDAGSKRDNPNPEAYRDARSLRIMTQTTAQVLNGDLTFKPYFRSVEMTFLQHFLPGQAIEENGHNSIGIQSIWTDADNRLRVGLEVDYTQGYLEETQPGPTISGSAFLVATIPAGKHYDYDVDARSLGAFVQRDIELSDALRLTAGVRFQHIRYEYDNNMISGRTKDDGVPCGFGGCRFNRPEDRSDTFNDWSPKLGLIYDLNDSSQLYATLSRGYRAPQATELYRLQNGQSVTDIDPVELDALDIGLRGANGSLAYSISLYAMEKDNFIFRDTSRQNIDGGETSHRGLELDLDIHMTDALSASLSFTWARHRYENNPALVNAPISGNDIDTAPQTMGTATLDWQASPALTFQFEWVHIGDYYEDPQNNHSYEGHDLLNLRSAYQLSDAVSLSARIMNLTDEDYAERADFSFGSDRYFVGTPASLYLGVTIDL